MVVIVRLPRFANPLNPTVERMIPVIIPMKNLVIESVRQDFRRNDRTQPLIVPHLM